MQFSTNEACPRRGTGMWLRTIIAAGFSILALTLSVPRAHAACGVLSSGPRSFVRTPMLASAGGDMPSDRGYDSIVGMWQTVYTSEGQVFAQTLKQWHADGTEVDNLDQNPQVGNICWGVWKPVDGRTVRLHHLGWLFAADGTPAGSMTLDETDTLAMDGMSYKGIFVFRTYDTNGNYTGTTVTGTIVASRVTVN